ncbi:UNVERIFIED_CONTAM: hypothetical protein FKN15_075130 [Acipenser sinensis]
MEYQLAVVFLLIAQLQSASGMSSLTYHGTDCLDDCQLNDGKYTCQSFTDGQKMSMYCSPQNGQDYFGRKCKEDHRCDKHGEQYYWCYIDAFKWGYCGLFINDQVHFGSQYLVPCQDSCEKWENTYFWCKTRKGWDYCSPIKNVDINGNKCKPDHLCGRYGQKYDWCNLEKGGWGKCGEVEVRELVYRSSYYNAKCQDECRRFDNKGYFWCNTLKGWDYCSPLPFVTFRNETCRADHTCGSHGYKYNWCYTQESWDYCGIIQGDECAYQSLKTRQQAISDQELICQIEDKGNRRQTIFTVEYTEQIVDGAYFEEATDVIAQCDYYSRATPGTLMTLNNLRIDLQGEFVRDRVRYNNFQMQINRPRVPGRSTTVAQVHIPVGADIPIRYIRRAFMESLLRRGRVWVTVRVCQQVCRI